MLGTAKLIIRVADARKILGRDAKDLTDTEIESLIITLTDVAAHFLRKSQVPKNKQVLQQRYEAAKI